jgi:hypothetical protein
VCRSRRAGLSARPYRRSDKSADQETRAKWIILAGCRGGVAVVAVRDRVAASDVVIVRHWISAYKMLVCIRMNDNDLRLCRCRLGLVSIAATV